MRHRTRTAAGTLTPRGDPRKRGVTLPTARGTHDGPASELEVELSILQCHVLRGRGQAIA
jgi:hypothetical protein